jgi:hypothetical protein
MICVKRIAVVRGTAPAIGIGRSADGSSKSIPNPGIGLDVLEALATLWM